MKEVLMVESSENKKVAKKVFLSAVQRVSQMVGKLVAKKV